MERDYRNRASNVVVVISLVIVSLFLFSTASSGVASSVQSAFTHISGTSVRAVPEARIDGWVTVTPTTPDSGQANTVVATVTLPADPGGNGAAFDPANGYIYVPGSGKDVQVINGSSNTIQIAINLGKYAYNLQTPTYVGGSVNDIYVPVSSNDPPPDNVTVISGATDTILTRLSTGENSFPTTGVYDSANGDLYVPQYGYYDHSNVTVINTTTNTVVANIPVGAFPVTPAYDPADGDIYVPNTLSNNLSIIDGATNKVVGTINITFPANGEIAMEDDLTQSPVYDPVTQEIYQPDTGNVTVTVIKGTTFVKNITVGPGPQTPAVDPITGNVFVPIAFTSAAEFTSSNDTLSVIAASTNTYLTNITVGPLNCGPETPVYDPVNGEMYVPIRSDAVTAVNASTDGIVATIGVGAGPDIPVFDTANQDLYVPNLANANVSVIGGGPVTHTSGPGTYPVTFSESGLPSGNWWNVALDGTTLNSTASSIVFDGISNGSHSFTIGPWQEATSACTYDSFSNSGSVSVTGAPKTVNVPFIDCGGSSSTGSGSGSAFLGLPGDDGYFLVIGVAAAVIVGAAALMIVRGRPPRGSSAGANAPISPPPPGAWTPPPPPPPPPPP
jgi:YVTN family beta-propeller protein